MSKNSYQHKFVMTRVMLRPHFLKIGNIKQMYLMNYFKSLYRIQWMSAAKTMPLEIVINVLWKAEIIEYKRCRF